ncbi:Membrane-bound transcription factor site-2 protease [Mortierella claussenii]|nr:Membrane-bound transcription factor site-2 protease [Mortierella claussenii]
MAAAQLLVPFLVTWFGIHVFLFLLQRFLNRPNLPVGPGSGPDYELLPTSTVALPNGAQSSPGAVLSKPGSSSPSTSGLLIKPFHVRFSTTALNSFFFRLGNSPRLARFWRVWYGLGVGFAMLAMVVGWLLLMYAGAKLVALAASFLWNLSPVGPSSRSTWGSVSAVEHNLAGSQNAQTNRFKKRDMDGGAGSANSATSEENGMVFVPVIPGVTLPLSHLPYYLIALLVSGIVHEAGHAIAAAREKTGVSSTGIFLYILYPGAFVDISSRALAIMSPLQQLRVMCAGVWHNAVLFLAAWGFLSSGALQLLFQLVGWRQMDDGLSVVNIAPESPLYDVLKVGSVITRVDDNFLKGDPLDMWSKLLLPSSKASDHPNEAVKQESGFCVPNTLLFVKPSDCCLFTPETQFGHSKDRSLSCFTPFNPSSDIGSKFQDSLAERVLAKDGQCLPSFEVLADPDAVRCTADKPICGEGSSCYRPFVAYEPTRMIRLYTRVHESSTGGISKGPIIKNPSTPHTGPQIVLYQGDPKDVWETVQVTTMGTRWSFLPLWLPNAILLTIQYTMSFSLALSVLNIVPARHLDGHHALKASAALLYSVHQSYKSTQSVQDSLRECLMDGGSGLLASSTSGVSTASFPKGSRVVKGIVASTTVLLGWVMVGSLVQMTATILWK